MAVDLVSQLTGPNINYIHEDRSEILCALGAWFHIQTLPAGTSSSANASRLFEGK